MMLAVLATTAIVTSCGWQLRGSYDFPPALVPIAVGDGDLADELSDTLRPGGVLARDAEAPAASRIEVLEESFNRRVLAVDQNGRAEEYELLYDVTWQLVAAGTGDNAQRILIAPQTARASRTYDYDSGAILSANQQEEALREDMRDDVAQRILFRLQAWSPGEV